MDPLPGYPAAMPFGLLAGLGAALAWGTMDIGSAVAGRRLGSLAVTAGGQVVSAIILLGLLAANGQSLPSTTRSAPTWSSSETVPSSRRPARMRPST